MQCEGIGNKRHSSRNGPMRGRARWMESGTLVPSRTANGPLRPLRAPPSPAMRWLSVLGNLGDGGGGWSSRLQLAEA